MEGVDTAQGFYPAKTVIAGGDVLSINRMLLPEENRPGMTDRKIEAYEPSLSGLVTLAGVPRRYDTLLHHTVFFLRIMNRNSRISLSINVLRSSLRSMYATRVIPSLSWCRRAAAIFILANAPYLSAACEWNEETADYGERVLSVLEGHGITGLSQADVLQRYTPGISLTILSPTGGPFTGYPPIQRGRPSPARGTAPEMLRGSGTSAELRIPEEGRRLYPCPEGWWVSILPAVNKRQKESARVNCRAVLCYNEMYLCLRSL